MNCLEFGAWNLLELGAWVLGFVISSVLRRISWIFINYCDKSGHVMNTFEIKNLLECVAKGEISCEEVVINLESSVGELKEVLGMVQPSVFYEADSIRRDDMDTYRLEKAKITSCTQPTPRWNFSASKATFKKNDYIEMWNSVLSIKKGIPSDEFKPDVLLVDDDATFLNVLSQRLEARGLKADTVTCGEEALEKIKGRNYNIFRQDSIYI